MICKTFTKQKIGFKKIWDLKDPIEENLTKGQTLRQVGVPAVLEKTIPCARSGKPVYRGTSIYRGTRIYSCAPIYRSVFLYIYIYTGVLSLKGYHMGCPLYSGTPISILRFSLESTKILVFWEFFVAIW